ncbi:hypothetical protein [Clostridium frigidicarnis]|uniref:Uncharacterized protein n=1 Tax=Clostridium frigidicarnis TaxID=84698 RepID=A0A1I0ZTZ9_9CLOT|nr:hypothetical protein [Clostridium frigidicarnis]SFB29259.1 hypothetical protein SAMN04488528_102533 [Clostridium frigidicarnis]
MDNEEYREYEKEYEEDNCVEEGKDYLIPKVKDECGEIKIYTKYVHIHVNCKQCGVLKKK